MIGAISDLEDHSIDLDVGSIETTKFTIIGGLAAAVPGLNHVC